MNHDMDTEIRKKIEEFAPAAELMPGVIIIHDITDLPNLKPVYMSSAGLKGLGITMEELSKMHGSFHKKFFNNMEMTELLEKMEILLKTKDATETFAFFQQVKLKDQESPVWFIGSVRIFQQDEDGNPTHVVCCVFPVEQMKHIPNKAERLLAESNFFRKNLEKFNSLGKRAREVLRLVALGKSSAEIANELSISVDTVNTHRKNIKKKLNISTNYEFTEYAHAFDLI